MHVVLKVVVSLLSKLDLFEVDFDANIADIDIFQTEIFLKAESALISDVSESIQQLFSPEFEQWNLWL